MEPPSTIHDVARWENDCRKIHARAVDFLEGRLSVIEAARLLSKLAFWAHLRDDPDLKIFKAIDSETDALPVGQVRERWAPEALAKQDVEIAQAEELYRATAQEAAARLRERFRWAIAARNARRE